jgi:hypothetical protein
MFVALFGACVIVFGIAVLVDRAGYALFGIGRSIVLSIPAIGAVVFCLSSAYARTEEGSVFNSQPNVPTSVRSCFCKTITGPYSTPIFVAVFFVLFAALRHCLLRGYDVKIDTKGIAFTQFKRVVSRLNFDEIDRAYDPEEFRSIHGVATAKIRVFGTGNRLRKGAKPIIVRLKQGRMKYWEINTVEPDVFLQKINEYLRNRALIG